MATPYSSSDTRMEIVRTELANMLGSLKYPTYLPGTPLESIKTPGIVVGIAAARNASRREPTTLGKGCYEWTDPFAAQLYFSCATDQPGLLDSYSALHAHELERAIEKYRFPGTASVDNDEIVISIQKVIVTESILNIIESEDRGSVIIRGNVITGVEWK